MRQVFGRTLGWGLLPAALLLLLAPEALPAQVVAANAHIVGVVVDRESEAPLGTVRVSLADTEGQEVWSGITDNRGRFRISRIPAGTYDLSFSRLGYGTATERVEVASEAEVDVRTQLASEAIELEPVVVTSSTRSVLQTVGFYDRQQRWDGGFFLREDIEDRNPATVPELIRGNSTFQVRGRAPDNLEIVSQRGGLGLIPGGQAACLPAIYVDGRLMADQPWDLITPDRLVAMEVYSTSLTPAQFYSHGGCGSIVMWTMQGELASAEARPTRSAFRRFVVAGAISASLFAVVF
jgi:hypothetical protein